MRISFDFDGTLDSNLVLQNLASTLIYGGAEVFILTARCKELNNKDVYIIADEIGIKHENIIFACQNCKAEVFENMKFDIHFDDNLTDAHKINSLSDNKPAMLVAYEFGEPNNERDW
jgi:PP-loop superfamily ATP-utilizing enzyme